MNRPAAVRRLLVENPEGYDRPDAAHRVLRPALGAGLFLAEGEEWRRQRRIFAPVFSPRAFSPLMLAVVRHGERMVEQLRHAISSPVALYHRLQVATICIAADMLFGIDLSPQAERVRALAAGYAARLAQPDVFDFILPIQVPAPRDLLRLWFRRRWIRLIAEIVAARRVRPQSGGFFEELEASEAPRGLFVQHVATMLITGSETTTAALFWTLHMLSARLDLQERIAAEAQRAFAAPPEDWMASLPFTRAAVSEGMRLYPPAFSIVRRARAADELDGVSVPKGTIVQASPWVIHRHHSLWERPNAFEPERFEARAAPVDRYAYLPFGIGPRQCVAAQFAVVESTLVLALLLRAFVVERVDDRPVTPVAQITLQPDDPPPYTLRLREH